jgi:hypothetical protein
VWEEKLEERLGGEVERLEGELRVRPRFYSWREEEDCGEVESGARWKLMGVRS